MGVHGLYLGEENMFTIKLPEGEARDIFTAVREGRGVATEEW